MTTQIEDAVRCRGEEWTLFATTAELLDVEALGLQFTFVSTACWDGYQCVYEVTERELLLQEFHAGLNPIPPSLFGVSPTFRSTGDFAVSYLSIQRTLPFTGGIVLATDLLKWPMIRSELYEFGRVLEVQVERGVVVEVSDRTSDVSTLRDRMGQAKAAFMAPPDGPRRSWEVDRLTLDLGEACEGTFYWKYFQTRLEQYRRLRAWADEKSRG